MMSRVGRRDGLLRRAASFSLRRTTNRQQALATAGNSRGLKPAARCRRSGRASVAVLLVVLALVVGTIGGYWLPKWFSAGDAEVTGVTSTESAHAPAGEDEQWYTCGMHPNVLQEGPGECPICHMKLTPLKKEPDAGAGDAAGVAKERKVLYWRAPMDPNYVADVPGKSPMGMDLIPVYADEAASASVHTIRIDPVTIQNMGIRTTTVRRGPLVKTVRTVGRVDYDEQLVTFIDTKFNGWIETLYVDETGQRVDEGDRLFDVYSPELYAAREEYLAAVRSLPHFEDSTFAPAREEAVKLVEAARTKLAYMDVSDEQIEALRQTNQVEKTLTFYSPASGIVTEKMALEGMYVSPGMRLYTIADLSRVWVYVDVYEYQLPWIRVGQRAFMDLPYVPGRQFVGKVVYIYPYLEQQTRVIQVRLEFENPALELKPGMFVNVRLESELQRDALLIPREAYIDSGTRQVVFIDASDGKFIPRDILAGVEAEDGMVEVLHGLDEGEVVVTSGQFMLDGESKLKEAVAKMMEAERAATTKRSPGFRATGVSEREDSRDLWMADLSARSSSIPPDAAYACPMETHPDESDPASQGAHFSTQPGRCPLCGMHLEPLDELDWVRLRRSAGGGDVAYTCPEHQHVFAKQPGDCPRCGNALTPFKVMYTCPDPQHASAISMTSGNCTTCGKGLAAFRGLWLDEAMADQNVPPSPGVAEIATYRCPVHPFVHSDREGDCTVCARPLEPTAAIASEERERQIPAGAKYTCPMQQCWQFSEEPDECAVCGMDLQPIGEVEWARELLASARPAAPVVYVCPMHPARARASHAGPCSICGMQLVLETALKQPTTAPGHVAAQMDYILEHYLEVQRLLASDRTAGLAVNALGLASASKELIKHLEGPDVKLPPSAAHAAEKLHAAALKIQGSLASDRVTFVDLSAAVRALVEHVRPDRQRWPRLYIYHCPMSKGDWLQSVEEKANPYYGFKMLNCGELRKIE